MQIHGYSQLTLLDYPGKLACTIFCGSCNFRCPFCHNGGLVLHPDRQPALDPEKILEHLRSRKGKLEGVCITGGEPTLQKDLPEFIGRIKELGYLVKLDTNGSNPDMLEKLITSELIDYTAMDIKASPLRYAEVSGLKEISMDKIMRSVDLLKSSGIDYEFRTTVVDEFMKDSDMLCIAKWLSGAAHYYLQQYRCSGELIAPEGLNAPTAERLETLRTIALPYIPNTEIRGVDDI